MKECFEKSIEDMNQTEVTFNEMMAIYINIDDIEINNRYLLTFSSLMSKFDRNDFKSVMITLLVMEKSVLQILKSVGTLNLEAAFEVLLAVLDSSL